MVITLLTINPKRTLSLITSETSSSEQNAKK